MVLHEEGDVDWLFNALEDASGLAFAGKHIFNMSRCRVNECVVFIEAATLHFGAFLQLIEQLEVLGEHHELCCCDDHEMRERRGPLDLLDNCAFSKCELLEDLPGG